MSSGVTLDPQWSAKLGEAVRRNVHEVTKEIRTDAWILCPVDYGRIAGEPYPHIKGTIRAELLTDSGRVWVGTDHWHYPEYGTRPHFIRSHGPWPLRSRRTGQIFGQIVYHPGTSEESYMRKALRRLRALRSV